MRKNGFRVDNGGVGNAAWASQPQRIIYHMQDLVCRALKTQQVRKKIMVRIRGRVRVGFRGKCGGNKGTCERTGRGEEKASQRRRKRTTERVERKEIQDIVQ